MEISVRNNVRFAVHDGEPVTATCYAPAEGGPFPAIVAVHGGGWRLRTAQAYRHWGPYLAQRGYALFDLDYRPVEGGKNRYPAAVHDVRAAVKFVRAEAASLRIDPNRIALMGDSAGAHLAALVALTGDSSSVKAVIGVYGVYDMLAQWEHDQAARPLDHITQAWLGVSPMENKRLYYEASPYTYTTLENNRTAFLVAWGTADDIVEPAQSERFVTALKQSKFYVRTAVLPGAPHFWMSDPLDEPGSFTASLAPRLLRFLSEKL